MSSSGDRPFVFDIEGYMLEWKTKLQRQIASHVSPVCDSGMDSVLKKIVFGYMVHHGYCGAAESFSKVTNLYFFEDIPSIQNRQRVQNLLMRGCIGDAITLVYELYPNLLSTKPDLLFKLQIRNFIEMINNLSSPEPASHPYSIASLMNGSEDVEQKMDVDHKPGIIMCFVYHCTLRCTYYKTIIWCILYQFLGRLIIL